jgi:hypothetical protein
MLNQARCEIDLGYNSRLNLSHPNKRCNWNSRPPAHMRPMHKEIIQTAHHEDTTTDGSKTDLCDPWDPPYPPFVPSVGADFSTNINLAIKVQ